jgi:hypothetical protein
LALFWRTACVRDKRESSFDATARPAASSAGFTIRLPEDSRAKLFRNASFAVVKLNEAVVAVELVLTDIDIFHSKSDGFFISLAEIYLF